MSNSTNVKLLNPRITAAVPQVHKQHPFVHEGNHKKLLDYCLARLQIGAAARDARMTGYAEIDRQVTAYLEATPEDKKRISERKRTGRQLAVDINLPLIHVHLTDMLTYYTGVFSPTEGMYQILGENSDQQQLGNALTSVMNKDAVHSNHFKAVLKSCAAALRYNLGGIFTDWAVEIGKKLEADKDTGEVAIKSDIVWAGNRLRAADMYNTFWDPRVVDPTEAHVRGEFCAEIEAVSFYEILKLSQHGAYYNTEAITDPASTKHKNHARGNNAGRSFYVDVANQIGTSSDDPKKTRSTDFSQFFAYMAAGGQTVTTTTGVEVAHLYIWLNPYQQFIKQRPSRATAAELNQLELWKISIAQGKRIIATVRMNNIHDQLPLTMGVVNEDSLLGAQKSTAEYLSPLQTFASFSLNTHVKATRKNIWGLTIYNPEAIDLSERPEGEVGGEFPVKAAYAGQPLDQIIWQHNGILDTKQTVGDIKLSMELLENFYPTVNMPNQVAGIDRAIEDQVATVKQGANRRLQMSAQMLDSGMFKDSRAQQYSNIVQYRKEAITFQTMENGVSTAQSVNPLDLQDLDIDEIMGQGLKAIDREAASKDLKELVFTLINSRVSERYNMSGLINKASAQMGIEVDLTEFELPVAAPQGVSGGEGTGEDGGESSVVA